VKRKLLLCCAVIIALALSIACVGCGSAADPLITVMNPIIENKMVDRIPLSPRLDNINGKTIYLVDINWGGPDAAYSVFEEVRDWFAKNNPSGNIIIRRKAGMYSANDTALWKEIAEKGNAAVIGISG
jgi:hypothetical protein